MQIEKFHREEAVTQSTPMKSSIPTEVESLSNVRHGSKKYWGRKCESYKLKLNEVVSAPVTPEEVPGLLTIKKRKRVTINPTKPVCAMQVHRLMEGKKILEEVQKLQDETQKKEDDRKRKADEKQSQVEVFLPLQGHMCLYKTI